MTHSLMLRSHEFSQDVGIVQVQAGQTLQAMLREAAGDVDVATEYLEVRVGGYVVPAAYWGRLRPKPGTAIHVTRMSLAGKGAKQIIAAVIIVVALIYGQGWAANAAAAWGGSVAVWQAGIMLAVSLAVTALTKPPSPSGSSDAAAKWNSLTGSSNQINPGGVIPFVIGESRYYPPHAAIPYSDAVGSDSYQYCLFDLGHGDIEVSDIRIGDTPLSDYHGVTYAVTRTPTIYTRDVSELVVGATMEDGDGVTRTTAPDITSIALDIVAPNGLYGVGTSGKDFMMSVHWRVEYRAVGATEWSVPSAPRLSYMRSFGTKFIITAIRKAAFAAGIEWSVPVGQYEVRVTRVETPKGGSSNTYVDQFAWSSMRSIKPTMPSTTGTNKLEMRIKATDQLNGTLQSLSCMVRQKIPVYDRTTGEWLPPAVNLNPAWVVYWLLNACPSLSKHVPARRIHLDTICDYAEFCDLHEFKARGVCDSATTAAELIEDVLACSLGSLGRRDGKYSIVFDGGDTLPSMTFSPLEISDFTMSRPFVQMPHALRMQFKNPDADYRDDEIIVLADGYSYRGVDARGVPSDLPEPEVFETMQLRFAQDARHAWRVGRFHFAQGKFRPEIYSFSSDIAGLGTVRGDVIDVAHDVTEWGAGWGRVQSIAAGDGGTAVVTLDQEIPTQPGTSYSAQFRRQDRSTVVVPMVATGGASSVLALASMPANVRPGDACVVGETEHVTAKLLVTGVRYTDGGQKTEFTAVRYDDRVAPYWTNPPENIASEITGGAYAPVPPPSVIGVISTPHIGGPSDAGILTPEIVIAPAANNQLLNDLLMGRT